MLLIHMLPLFLHAVCWAILGKRGYLVQMALPSTALRASRKNAFVEVSLTARFAFSFRHSCWKWSDARNGLKGLALCVDDTE